MAPKGGEWRVSLIGWSVEQKNGSSGKSVMGHVLFLLEEGTWIIPIGSCTISS